MRPTVKICGITRPEDAELALELGADFVGVILYGPSPRSVAFDKARELLAVIPEGRRVAVDVSPGSLELERYREAGFDRFQIHCPLETGLGELAVWSGLVGEDRLWMAPKVSPGESFPQRIFEFCDTALVDAFRKDKYGGTGETADWQRFVDWATLYNHKQFILAGGLGPKNIREALEATGATFVDANSALEARPGEKDHALMRAFFEAL
ncbi:MAG: phosphoribosylanthranilate isomerase [Opitutales bacterium]